MIYVKILPIKSPAAILTCIAVALENVVPRELDFLVWESVEEQQQYDAGDADSNGNGSNDLIAIIVAGKITPFAK